MTLQEEMKNIIITIDSDVTYETSLEILSEHIENFDKLLLQELYYHFLNTIDMSIMTVDDRQYFNTIKNNIVKELTENKTWFFREDDIDIIIEIKNNLTEHQILNTLIHFEEKVFPKMYE